MAGVDLIGAVLLEPNCLDLLFRLYKIEPTTPMVTNATARTTIMMTHL